MTTVVSDPPKNKRLADLARRALDPSAMDGEAETSAVLLIRHARRHQMGLDDFVGAIAPGHQLPPPPQSKPKPRRPEPPACSIVMSQGKHAGQTLGEIARKDIEYVAWMAREFRDVALRDAAEVVLEHFTTKGAA